jgi:hypothetical protein
MVASLSACRQKTRTAWDLLPPATAVVLEHATTETLKDYPVGAELTRTLRLDSLQTPCFVAWVLTEKDKIEPFIALNKTGMDIDKMLSISVSAHPERRKLNGFEFAVYRNENTRVAVLQVDNMAVVSENPLAVESVIRTIAQNNGNTRLPALRKMPNRKKDYGTLYVDWNHFSMSWPLGGVSILDVQRAQAGLVLDGFTLSDTTRHTHHLLSLASSQRPVQLTLQNFVPQGATRFLHLGLSDPVSWYEGHRHFLGRKNPALSDSLRQWETATGFSAERFFSALDGEIGFVATDRGNLIALRLKEISKAAGELRKLAGQAASAPEESALFFLEQGQFVQQLFWPLAPGFSEVHYAFEDQLLLLADSQAALEFALDKINIDQTWGRTLSWQQAHQAMLAEANVSFFFAEPLSVRPFPSGWTAGSGFAQFSNIDRQFYTALAFQLAPAVKPRYAQGADKTAPPVQQIMLGAEVRSGAYPVINHQTKGEELALADAAGRLHLISDSKSLWSVQVGELQSLVFQIDYFNNKKLQYVFLAGQKLFVVDRLGRMVTGFPVDVPQESVRDFVVVDYGQSRNYRFLVLGETGNAFLLDAKGGPLEGWRPNRFPERIQKIRFQRMRGKDYFVALSKRKMYLVNRRGEMLPGFPVDMKEDLWPDFYADARKGTFVLLTHSGRLLEVRPDAAQSQEHILPKNSVEAQFFMLSHPSKLYIGLLDRGKVSVFDHGRQLLFEAENPASNRIVGQVAGTDPVAFVFYDEEQHLVFALSPGGDMLLHGPLESAQMPRLSVHTEAQINLYTVQGAKVLVTPLK